MSYQSTSNAIFLATVEKWIEENNEVLVLIRFSASAGRKDFEFYDSFELFKRMILELRSGDCIIVFRLRQLPLRGRVSKEFTTSALELLSNGTEWLLLALDKTNLGITKYHQHTTGETLEELKQSLSDFEDRDVAFGAYPPWLEDNESVISAVVPEPDGSVIPGIYQDAVSAKFKHPGTDQRDNPHSEQSLLDIHLPPPAEPLKANARLMIGQPETTDYPVLDYKNQRIIRCLLGYFH